jgi:hypothetical protein
MTNNYSWLFIVCCSYLKYQVSSFPIKKNLRRGPVSMLKKISWFHIFIFIVSICLSSLDIQYSFKTLKITYCWIPNRVALKVWKLLFLPLDMKRINLISSCWLIFFSILTTNYLHNIYNNSHQWLFNFIRHVTSWEVRNLQRLEGVLYI